MTGELLWGRRTQDEPWSTPLIHSSWKVAWAAAEATREAANASLTSMSLKAEGIPERKKALETRGSLRSQ